MLHTLWKAWSVIARQIGRVQSLVVLTLIYFVLAAPFALVVRLSWSPFTSRVRVRGAGYHEGRVDHEPEGSRPAVLSQEVPRPWCPLSAGLIEPIGTARAWAIPWPIDSRGPRRWTDKNECA